MLSGAPIMLDLRWRSFDSADPAFWWLGSKCRERRDSSQYLCDKAAVGIQVSSQYSRQQSVFKTAVSIQDSSQYS
jgi:hypothetical protein